MSVSEPITLLTDYLMAALTAAFSVLLWYKARHSRQVSQRLWALAFAASAAAAFLGGSWHGFHSQLLPVVEQGVWRATTCSIGLAALMMLLGALRACLYNPWRNRLARISVSKFLLYLVVVNLCDSYLVVIADYALNMLAVLYLCLLRFKTAAFASWCITAILTAFVAAAWQVFGYSLNAEFNHNVVYHVIQAFSYGMFYRAGLLLGDHEERVQVGGVVDVSDG